MEELKLLIDMVAGLPTLAIWVLVGFLVYKIAVIGSTYGIIKLFIIKFHAWKIAPKQEVFKFGSRFIDEEVKVALLAQISRLDTNNGYLHMSGVIYLRDALDDKFAKDEAIRELKKQSKGL